MRRTALLLVTPLLLGAGVAAAQPMHPVKIPSSEAHNRVMNDPAATSRTNNGHTMRGYSMGKSADGKLTSGVYDSTGSTSKIDSYRVDEFMYFIRGSVKLTSDDGHVTDIKAGDAVFVPKGWKGTWESPGYTKYYVIYNASAQN